MINVELIAAIIFALIIIIEILRRKIINWNKKRKFRKGLLGEIKAGHFLKKKGYEILNYQKEIKYCYEVENEIIEVRLRPDYIVKKNGKKYIAEVKTGEFAPDVKKNKLTRRQLLEYNFATDNYGVLLIDIDKEQILKIKFYENEKLIKRRVFLLVFYISIFFNILFILLYFFNFSKLELL